MTQLEKDFLKTELFRACGATVLVAVMCIIGACKNNATNARDNSAFPATKQVRLEKINHEIETIHHTIDSLRSTVQQRTQDALQKHPKYAYVMSNAHMADSLADANKKLLSRARDIAVSQSIFDIPRVDTYIFQQYRHVPEIRRIGRLYAENAQQIAEYNQQKNNLLQIQLDAYRTIDKLTLNDVRSLQYKLDSLLNVKDSVITHQR